MSGWGFGAPPGVTAAASLVAGLLLLWGAARELRGPGRRRGLRATLLAASLAALLALALRPHGPGRVAVAEAWLRTPGAGPETAERSGAVFELPGASGGGPARSIADLGALRRHWPSVRRLRVVGFGLPEWSWRDGGLEISRFEPPALPSGIRALEWNRSVAVGGEVEAWGTVATDAPGRLVWSGPEGELAELEVAAGETAFRFTGRPRGAGRLLYRLRLVAAAEVEEAVLDVVSVAPTLPRIAWLESAPDFESRRLRNWYETLGGQLVVRSRISRERYRIDSVNRLPVDPVPFASGALEDLDLVVVDLAAWEALGGGGRRRVESAVRDGGLGLLLRLASEEAPPAAGPFGPFEVAPVEGAGELAVRVLGSGFASGERLRVEARQIAPAEGVFPLLRDAAGRVLAARRPIGRGSVGVSLLTATHRWALAGAEDDWAGAWSALLSAVARSDRSERFTLPTGPIWADEPLEVEWSGSAGPPSVQVATPDGRSEALAFAHWRPDGTRWRGTYRPRSAGWHRLESAEGASAEFRVGADGTLPALRAERAVRATRAWAVLGARRAAGGGEPALSSRPLPRAPLFLAWLLASGWLWLEERRRPADRETG